MPGYELNMGHQVGCLAGQGRSKCFEIEMPALIFKNNLCKGTSPQNMVLYGTVPPFLDPEIPIDGLVKQQSLGFLR